MRVERATNVSCECANGRCNNRCKHAHSLAPTRSHLADRTPQEKQDRHVGRLSTSSSRSERGTSSPSPVCPLSFLPVSPCRLSAKNLLPSFRKFPPRSSLRDGRSFARVPPASSRATGSVEVRMSKPTSAPLLSSSARRMSEHCDASRRRCAQVLDRSPFLLEMSDGLLMMMTMKAARHGGSVYGWHPLLPDQVTAFTPCSHCRRMAVCQ